MPLIQGVTLGQGLNHVCNSLGTKTAISNETYSLSYARLAQEAAGVAASLRALGIAPNEPVHITVSNHPLDMAAFLGVWNAGGVAVPIHRTMTEESRSKISARTGARLQVDMQTGDAKEGSCAALVSVAIPPPRSLLDNAAFIIFTSGSTGTPKGVVVSHNAFCGKITQIDSLLGFGPDDRTLLVLNITFSFGLWVALLTLLRGGTLLMRDKFDARGFLRTLLDERITRVGMVPTMMRVIFSDPDLIRGIDAVQFQGTLSQILIGGESLGKTLATTIRKSFANTELIDIYGLTETATCDFFSFPDEFARYPGCIGRPSPNVAFRIVDGTGAAVPPGGIGELQIRSPYLMQGYLDDPDLTALSYHDGWFRTGDLARTVDANIVELMGRSKEIISRAGNKVTPGEIEQALCSHPDVSAAMAVGIADAVLGERIHVLLVPRLGSDFRINESRSFFDSKLEKYKRPDAYYLAEELPLGRTGKADRTLLKALITSGTLLPAGPDHITS
jgi:long-chain acyl-CoA synthetase